jgi:hypothetical protein
MKISILCFLFITILTFLYIEHIKFEFELIYALTNSSKSLNIELLSLNGSLIPDGKFLIVPDPYQKLTRLEIADNELMDSNKTIGIISLKGISNNNYTITQKASNDNYLPNTISKIVEIKDDDSPIYSVLFVNNFNSKSENPIISTPQSFTYNAKFVCGSIRGDEGPLRPGHYDTDISIYNKQNYPITLVWNTVINDYNSSNSLIKTVNPKESTGLICKDIKQLANLNPQETSLIEGFVIIQIEEINISSENKARFTDEPVSVQVFYTANALDSLPQETLVEKFVFQIINDPTGKIPQSFLNKDLEVLTRTDVNSIVPQDFKIQKILSSVYNLTNMEIKNIQIVVKETDLGVGNMIDDHAISLLRLSSD